MKDTNYNILSMLEDGVSINVIGDSIAAGVGASDSLKTSEIIIQTTRKTYFRRESKKSWSGLFKDYLITKFPQCGIVNNGCGGIRSSEVREKLDELINEEDKLVIILLGANDRKVENGMKILKENLIYIIRYLKKKDKKIIIMSPPPSTAKNEAYPNRLYHMNDVNAVIKEVAEQEDIKFINYYEYINKYIVDTGESIEELMNEKDCMSDGLHPTDKVYFLMFRHLLKNLNLIVK